MGGSGVENVVRGPRPDMLPLDTVLVGRDDELKMLLGFLAQGRAARAEVRAPVQLAIFGQAGVGKSALGTKLAYAIEDEYPHGALYVDLNDIPTVDGALDTSQILRSFLLELLQNPDRLPQEAPDLRQAFIKATDRKRLIVFLDNVRSYQAVKNLIPRSPTCLVVFTSNKLLDDTVRSLHLSPLSESSALKLFKLIAPSLDTEEAQARGQLTKILQACDGLPIAIRVLAARLEHNDRYPLGRILEDLERYQYQPHMNSLFGADRRKIDACFRVSYDALTVTQALLFCRLAVVPGESFDVPLAAYLGDLTIGQAEEVLEDLCSLQLIQETQDRDYFTMHSLWRQFAREQLDDQEAAEQLTNVLSFYCEQAEVADQAIRALRPMDTAPSGGDHAARALREQDSVRERDRALDWMEKQHLNLVAAVKRACEQRAADIAWRTCRALVEFFDIRGKWESWGQTHEVAEKIVHEQSLGSAHLNYGLGRLHGSRREWPEAIECYRAAIATFLQHGEQVQAARGLNSLGDAYRYMRNWSAAENCFQYSLNLLRDDPQPRQEAIAKRSMSTIYRQRGDFEKAEKYCLDAIEILDGEEMRSDRWIAATRLSLADIWLDSGLQDPRPYLEECLAVFEELEDTHWLILTRRSLAEALRQEGLYDAAMQQLQLSSEALRQSQEDPHWEGQILHSIGLVYLDQHDTAQARKHFDQALRKFRVSPDLLWEGRTLVSIGRAAAAAGRTGEARAHYYTAWPLLVEQGAAADLERLEDLLNATPPGSAAGTSPDADR